MRRCLFRKLCTDVQEGARAAFMAGMVFDHMLKKGDITQDMICADFFRILDDEVFKAMEEDKA